MNTPFNDAGTPVAQCAAKLQCVVLTRNLDQWLQVRAASNSRSTSGQIVAELQRLMLADAARIEHATFDANIPIRTKKRKRLETDQARA